MAPDADYRGLAYWLDDAGDLTPRSQLDGDTDVDVAVLGAGYSGLWTAYYLRQRDPTIRVVILESEIAGFGASGRNGGWCNATMMGLTVAGMRRRYGVDGARAIITTLRRRVDEIGAVCNDEGVDACFRKSGVVRMARGRHELPALREKWSSLEEVGLTDGLEWLSAPQVAERVRIAEVEAGYFDPNVAWVHPGRLARGLAGAVERHGVTIHERTPVAEVKAGRRPAFHTPGGRVRADVLVLAGEAYLTQLPRMRRLLLPLYSLVVLTEPLSPPQWSSIGWEGGEGLSSSRLSVDYVSRSHDGRILFGGRGAPYHFGSAIRSDFDQDERTHAMLLGLLQSWFPNLDVEITHKWGGPLGVTRDWTPNVYLDERAGLAGAYGYTGQGVAASNLAGQILADRITGVPSDEAALPFVGHRSRRWEPEPLRWLGVSYIQRALGRLDRLGEGKERTPTGRSLAERLMRQ